MIAEQTNNDIISESCYHTLHFLILLLQLMLPYFADPVRV